MVRCIAGRRDGGWGEEQRGGSFLSDNNHSEESHGCGVTDIGRKIKVVGVGGVDTDKLQEGSKLQHQASPAKCGVNRLQ